MYDAHDSLHNQRVSPHLDFWKLGGLPIGIVATSSQGHPRRLKHRTGSAKIGLAVKTVSNTPLQNELGRLNGSNAAVRAETSHVGPPEQGSDGPTNYSKS